MRAMRAACLRWSLSLSLSRWQCGRAAAGGSFALIGQPAPAAAANGGAPRQPISTSPLLLKVKKQQKKAKAGAAPEKVDTDACSPQLLQELNFERVAARCDAELSSFQELLFRNLRLQLTPDVFFELEASVGGKRVPLGSLADIVQKGDTIVIDLGANRHAMSAALQALALKGFAGSESADSACVYVSVPRVTREHRQRLAASGRELLQRAKLSLRRLHDSCSKKLKELERSKKFSADDIRSCQRVVVNQFKAAAAEADRIWAAKEAELLG